MARFAPANYHFVRLSATYLVPGCQIGFQIHMYSRRSRAGREQASRTEDDFVPAVVELERSSGTRSTEPPVTPREEATTSLTRVALTN
jgi:hypothetical protein